MRLVKFILLSGLVLFLLTGCDATLNRTIRIKDGEKVGHSLNSVNGSVIIGSDCVVRGSCRSVNGRVEIGSNSEVDDLQSVNGRIRVASHAEINGDIESVNGSVTCAAGVKIRGRIASINGSIELDNAIVKRDVVTFNGNISLKNETIVQGDIIIKDAKFRSRSSRILKITIADGSVVEGDILVRDRDKKVRIYLSNGGQVKGRIEGGEVIHE